MKGLVFLTYLFQKLSEEKPLGGGSDRPASLIGHTGKMRSTGRQTGRNLGLDDVTINKFGQNV